MMKEIDNKSESLKITVKICKLIFIKRAQNCGSKETCKDVASRKCYSKKTFR